MERSPDDIRISELRQELYQAKKDRADRAHQSYIDNLNYHRAEQAFHEKSKETK